jgi:hypothetical protein
MNKPIGKCLSIFKVQYFIVGHLIDLLYPLLKVFIEYRELAFLNLAVNPDHFNERNNVKQISLRFFDAEHAEIFSGLSVSRHRCFLVPNLRTS